MIAISIIVHPFQPVYDENSRVLILGSFPSVKSREGEFYYHHPQNRFWKVISAICNVKLPVTISEKKNILLSNNIALWDVIKSCEITGSSDSSIRYAVPNDIVYILKEANIVRIITNGGTAFRLYMKHIYPRTGIQAVSMPSTSPANAAFSLEKLITYWESGLSDINIHFT